MIIRVKAKTNTKQNKILKNEDGSFTVWTTEKAVDGKANRAITKIIANYFDKPSGLLILKKGQKSNIKVFEIR